MFGDASWGWVIFLPNSYIGIKCHRTLAKDSVTFPENMKQIICI